MAFLYEPNPYPTRLPGETLQQYQDRVDAWFRAGGSGGLTTTTLPGVGIPPPVAKFPTTGDAERLGDFASPSDQNLPPATYVTPEWVTIMPVPPLPPTPPRPPPDRTIMPVPPTPRPPPGFFPSPPSPGGGTPVVFYGGPAGALPSGLRVPFDEDPAVVAQRIERERILAATHFDVLWGEPPARLGLRWSRTRYLYEATLDQDGAPYRRAYSTNGNKFLQAYQDVALGPGRFGLRWVEVFTNLPDPARPYRIVPKSEESTLYAPIVFLTGKAAGDGEGTERTGFDGATGADEKLPRGPRIYLPPPPGSPPGTPPTLWEPPPPPSRAPPKEFDLGDYAWIAQRDLPLGCPYPYPYLPVPQDDYASGRWLSPDYTPSIPLPPPYDLTPWQCGVPEYPGVERKGPPDRADLVTRFETPPDDLDEVKLSLPVEPSSTEPTPAGPDVRIPPPTGSAAPAAPAPEKPAAAPAKTRAEIEAELVTIGRDASKLETDLKSDELSHSQRAAKQKQLAELKKLGSAKANELDDKIRAEGAAKEAEQYALRKKPDVGIPPPTGLPLSPRGGEPPPPPPPPPPPHQRAKLEFLKKFEDTSKRVKELIKKREALIDESTAHRKEGTAKIDEAIQAVRAALESTPASSDYPPPHLKAIVWSLEQYVEPARQGAYLYGNRSEGLPNSLSPYNSGDWKCNKLVGDAYAVGAGVGVSKAPTLTDPAPDRSKGYPAKTDPETRLHWGPLANALANPNENLRSMTMARPLDETASTTDARGTAPGTRVRPKPGDIVAFPAASGSGHSALYLGKGLVVSAKGTGIEIGTIDFERTTHSGKAMVRQWTGSGR